ncbi:SDR family NAD(P)-dependent oxidoreductase [Streptomyces sp. NPDC056237]|uniref:SDR family NAD(P)-dependent oxidoreductase n=1 Tax=Streptomyces sp. NPDC056237 TaxID=3345758 RepID=UPI0035D62BF5
MIDKSVCGPWVVVAGGSEGVGASFAHRLADPGINLILIARKPGPLNETAERARAKGVEVRTLELDLFDLGALASVRAVTDGPEVGLLIFNAGANSYGHEFVTGELDRVQGVLDLNITAQLARRRQVHRGPVRPGRHRARRLGHRRDRPADGPEPA